MSLLLSTFWEDNQAENYHKSSRPRLNRPQNLQESHIVQYPVIARPPSAAEAISKEMTNPMRLPFGIYNLINPERYIWTQVLLLHKTDKAILVYNDIENLDTKVTDTWNKVAK
jgi:hypothetical protein